MTQFGTPPPGIVRNGPTLRDLGVGLAMRTGHSPIDPRAPDHVRHEQERDAERGDRFRDLSLVDVCRETLRATGRDSLGTPLEVTHRALSTMELPNVFTTAFNASLSAGYEQYGDTTQGWTLTSNLATFQTAERPRVAPGAGLRQLPRGQEAKHRTVSDVMESYKPARYAEQFVLDDQDIIDDRLDALMTTPQQMGADAARLRPDLVYSILLANDALGQDSVALFSVATHLNLLTDALDVDGLTAGMAAMSKRRENGVPLNLRPRHLIVPQDLLFTGRQLVESSTLIGQGANAAPVGEVNPIKVDALQLHSDDRIGVNGVTDPATGTAQVGTATNWFLSSDRPMVEVGYVNAQAAPRVRSGTLDRGKYGVWFDVKLDLGAKALDWRGLQMSSGVA